MMIIICTRRRRRVRRHGRNPSITKLDFRSRAIGSPVVLVRLLRVPSFEKIQGAEGVRGVVDVAGSASVRKDRDRLRCALEVDGERITEEMLCLADIIDEVADEARRLNERKTKN